MLFRRFLARVFQANLPLKRSLSEHGLLSRSQALVGIALLGMLCALSPSRAWAQAVAPNLNPSSNLFLDAPAYGSGGPHAFGIVLADLNGDGKQDVIVANACTGCSSAS